MPAERQNRRLDQPSGKPEADVAMKAPQPFLVDGMGVHPDVLDQL
jgi:hypothetical protein